LVIALFSLGKVPIGRGREMRHWNCHLVGRRLFSSPVFGHFDGSKMKPGNTKSAQAVLPMPVLVDQAGVSFAVERPETGTLSP
jgi:hypothetical protein